MKNLENLNLQGLEDEIYSSDNRLAAMKWFNNLTDDKKEEVFNHYGRLNLTGSEIERYWSEFIFLKND